MKGWASGAFLARRFTGSHSSFFPARKATLPRWFASVSQPEYSKFALGCVPLRIALNQSS